MLYKMIDIYAKHNFHADYYFLRTTTRKLCEARDNSSPHFFERGELTNEKLLVIKMCKDSHDPRRILMLLL